MKIKVKTKKWYTCPYCSGNGHFYTTPDEFTRKIKLICSGCKGSKRILR